MTYESIRQAGAEIEVTPAMIDAGKCELAEHRFLDDVEYVLESVFRAMLYANASASETSDSR
jgi:hypothetical protein